MIYLTLGRTGISVSTVSFGREGFAGKTPLEALTTMNFTVAPEPISSIFTLPIRNCVPLLERHLPEIAAVFTYGAYRRNSMPDSFQTL